MEIHLRKFRRIPTKFDRGKSKNIDFVLQKIRKMEDGICFLNLRRKIINAL